MFKNYFRIAARILARNKLYTLINVLGLALGVCGCIVIWLVGSFEMSFDRFHPDGDRIYRVVGNNQGVTIPPMPEAMRKQIPGLGAVTAVYDLDESSKVKVPIAGKPGKVYEPHMEGQEDWITGIALADQNWPKVFPYHWLAGNPAVALMQPFSVVLTERAVKHYFGNMAPIDIIGRELIYDDSLHVRVTGVVRDWAEHSDQAFTDLISFATIDVSFLKKKRHLDDWVMHMGMGKWFWPSCYVKLDRGIATAQIEVQMDRIMALQVKSNPEHPFHWALQPLADIHFNNEYSDNRHKANLPTLYALTGIALFILILAVVNFVNLSTAQSLQRAKEIGVRKVLGSGRRGLVVQFLVETGVLTAVAVVAAGLLVWPVIRSFQDYVPNGVVFDPLAPGNIVFLAGIWFAVTMLAGFYPARVLAGYQPVQTLKGSASVKGGEKWWLRRSLIVFQFTISLVFIILTLVIGNQIRFMLNTDYGFKTDAVVTVAGQWNDTTGKIKVLEQKFSQIPGIAHLVREEDPPAGWGRTTMQITYKGKAIVNVGSTMEFADERYVPFYGMRLVAGRNIRNTDSLAEFVINETAAKQLGFAGPAAAVGQLLYVNDKPYPIVGVVADFHEGSFRETVQPATIGNRPREENMLGIRLASAGKGADNVKATLDAMGKIYKEIFPKESFHPYFMDDLIREMYNEEQKTASLVRVAMGLAIFISCMGLFGLSLFTAERRAGEIGIRKVLGATTADIAVMLNRQFIRLVLLALVMASPVAWILVHRWLQDFAYRVPVDWWVFVLAGLGAIGLAVATVSYQSIRAAMASPVKSLKAE
ncbi:MAG TPA: ABC transporter permease [Puia sp.]|jgi:ABC-type antimicrobial peptide transport system permease subunit|nr:ABC transporter permease [Puia sp.]